MAARTLSWVSGLMRLEPDNTRETVEGATPETRATSLIVAVRLSPFH